MASFTRTTSRLGRRGFTIAEGLISATVLAAAVIGVVGPLIASHQNTALYQETSVATSLADQLMEEIAAKPYVDPTDGSMVRGPEAGETTRALFDNVDDYHGYRDTITPQGGQGSGYDGGVPYTRAVSIEYRTAPAGPAADVGEFLLVTVTVNGPRGPLAGASRLVAHAPGGS